MTIRSRVRRVAIAISFAVVAVPVATWADEGPPADPAMNRLLQAETAAREAEATVRRGDPELKKAEAAARAAQAKFARERAKVRTSTGARD